MVATPPSLSKRPTRSDSKAKVGSKKKLAMLEITTMLTITGHARPSWLWPYSRVKEIRM
jgi:hypothetical protein